jgi:glycosyltransferase involved in cell wall biosynthesis
MRLAIVVPFQDEGTYLTRLLDSLDRQSRPADLLILVDDGSRDGSESIADRFAEGRDWVRVRHLPRRPPSRDRLQHAPEYRAFLDALADVEAAGEFDVIAKLDGDLELPRRFLETIERELAADPGLGIVGSTLAAPTPTGETVVERLPRYHVRGATKFYRRACLAAIGPCEAILGWDTIDELKARMHGWSTRSVDLPDGHVLHLRPVGTRDGLLRAYRRWGVCAYAIGYHPLWVLLGAARRAVQRPYLLGGLAYAWGWIAAHRSGVARAEPEVRRYARREQMGRLRRRLRRQRM